MEDKNEVREKVNMNKQGLSLIEKIQETINKYNLIDAGDKIVVAVSGGPDSICMLDALIKIAKKTRNQWQFKLPKKPGTSGSGNCCCTC